MHGGGMGGGMHGGGMGGGAHFGGGAFRRRRAFGGGIRRARFAHAGFSPRFSRAAFHITASITASIALRSLAHPTPTPLYSSCWRRVWTPYGLQWVNVCSDYGYY